jgi:hypothetical protein
LQPPSRNIKSTIAESSSTGITKSNGEFLPNSVAASADLPSCPESVDNVAFVSRSTPNSLILKVDLQEKSAATSEGLALASSKRAVLPQDSLLHSAEGTDEEFVTEEEKWRTDRFFLGTVLYVAINPRALTEKCASGANCPFHPFCDFAHEPSELRERPLTQMWNFKTKLCDKFHSTAACCPYGNRWYVVLA